MLVVPLIISYGGGSGFGRDEFQEMAESGLSDVSATADIIARMALLPLLLAEVVIHSLWQCCSTKRLYLELGVA